MEIFTNPSISVILDSNVIIGECYDFSSNGKLTALVELAKQYHFKLVISEVSFQEVKRHIIDDISDIHSTYEGIKNRPLNETTRRKIKHARPILKDIPDYDFLFIPLPQCSKMVADAISRFESFVRYANFEIMDYHGVEIDKIMRDYFEEKPPFEKKKKEEFPDAVIVEQIRQYKNENDTSLIAVVSDDKGVQLAIDPLENVYAYGHISDFNSEVYTQISGIDSAIKTFISPLTIQKEIEGLLEDKLYETPVDGRDIDRHGVWDGFDYDEVEITQVELTSCDFESYTIDAIVKDAVVISITCTASLTANCTFFDEDNSVWDSEDKEYIYASYGNIIEDHETLFSAEIHINGFGTESVSITAVLIDLELDESTRVNRLFPSNQEMELDAAADMMDTLEDYANH